jgi:hypothetical protein
MLVFPGSYFALNQGLLIKQLPVAVACATFTLAGHIRHNRTEFDRLLTLVEFTFMYAENRRS